MSSYFQEYLALPSVGAWDGDGHYAINKYYSENIFPALNGWVPSNNAGLPWPVGYTPLLTYLLAIWSRLLPTDFITAYKLFFILLNLAFPLTVYGVVWQITKRKVSAFLSALLTIYLLLMPVSIVYFGGITMRATFAMGHYPQFLATTIFVVWLWAIFKEGRKWHILSAALLGLVLLANLHTFQICLILLTIKWTFDLLSDWRAASKKIALTIVIAIAISIFWSIPLVQNSAFFLTKTTGEVDATQAVTSLGLIGVGGFFVVFAELIRSRSRGYMAILWLTSAAIFLVSVLPLRAVFPGLPVQPDRLLPYSFFLLILILPQAIYNLTARFKRTYRFGLFLFIAAAICLSLKPAKFVVDGNFKIDNQVVELIKYVKLLPNGRSIAEAWFDPIENVHDEAFQMGQPTHMVISGQLADGKEHETLWGVFRESSINSPFIQPIRNSLSPAYNEAYGVVCWLCNNEPELDAEFVNSFNGQPVLTSLKRAQLYGVNYIIARSDQMKATFRASSHVQLLKVFGDWEVFEIKTTTELAETLAAPPILTFTSLKNRDREFNSYDWLRLNEDWIYYTNFKHVMAYAHNQDLATTNELSKFELVNIVEYKYSDLAKAFENLKAYAVDNSLILWQSEDPLFVKLNELKNANIVVIPKTGNVHHDFGEFLSRIPETDQQPVQQLAVSKSVNNNRFELEIANAEQVYVKYSYFPTWQLPQKVDIYMASPAQILLLSSSEEDRLHLRN
jgi:hypothetical protein